MQQLQASLVGIVADHEQGPHQLIAHENLKVRRQGGAAAAAHSCRRSPKDTDRSSNDTDRSSNDTDRSSNDTDRSSNDTDRSSNNTRQKF
eukprot:362101-Chlamydomonas_euryale.AAC.2